MWKEWYRKESLKEVTDLKQKQKLGWLLHTKSRLYMSYVRSLAVYGSETCPVKDDDVKRLEYTEMSMVRWM